MNHEPKKCSRCLHADAVIAMDCRRCHSVAIVMVMVHKHFEPSALEAFAKVLRGKHIAELSKDCPAGAYKSRSIFNVIHSMAFPAKMDPNNLKSAVADQILRDMGEFEGIRAYDQKHGEGSWIKGCSTYVGKKLREAMRSKEESIQQ